MSAWRGALIAMLAAALAYLPVLRAEFVWDDQWMRRDQIPAYTSVLSPFDARTNPMTWIYRPLGALSYLLEESINRRFIDPGLPRTADAADPARARVPHAFSLLFHVLATGAVTLLAAELLKARRAGLLGATAGGLIFALHPIHVENVAWVGARADSLATLFFVVSLLALFEARRNGGMRASVAAAAAYLLALLSKENAAVGVFLVPFVLRAHPEPRVSLKPLLKPVALYGGMLALYLVLRRAGGGTVEFGRPPDLDLAAAQGFAAAAYYVRKILIPWPLTPLQLSLPGPAATLALLAGTLAVAALAVALLRRGERIHLLCLAWFAATCLPVLPLALRRYVIASVSERYLYLPSVAFAVAAGAVAAALVDAGRRRAAGAVLCALLAVYGTTTWFGAMVWRDNLTLFTAMTRQPDLARHPIPWIGLGNAYRDRQNPAEAERCFLRVLAADIAPNPALQAGAWHGLGELRQAEAEDLLASGRAEAAADRFREAEELYSRAVAGDSGSAETRASRALVRMQLLLLGDGGGPSEEAVLTEVGRDIAEVSRLDPSNPFLPVLRGTYRSLGGVGPP